MKVIVAGSRNLVFSTGKIQEFVDRSGFRVTELVCGMAPGVDTCAEIWARERNVPVKQFPADWDGYRRKYGSHKRAGRDRNSSMAEYADALILVWDGSSPGSASMKELALERGLFVFEIIIKKRSKNGR